jgi:Tc5 transposase DNA-binding domain/helix-turn-helix, Psq domain
MDLRLENRDPIILQAIDYSQNNPEVSIRQIAKLFGVPRTSLRNQLRNPTTRQIGQEINKKLSFRHERWLVEWIISEEARGYAPNHARVREAAQKLANACGIMEPIGKAWVSKFKHRHSEIKMLIGKRHASDRFEAVQPAILKRHFDDFHAIKIQYRIKEENEWNMDETGTAVGSSTSNSRVLGSAEPTTARKRSKTHTRVKTLSNSEWVTVIECINASRRDIKPLIIFKGASVQL